MREEHVDLNVTQTFNENGHFLSSYSHISFKFSLYIKLSIYFQVQMKDKSLSFLVH